MAKSILFVVSLALFATVAITAAEPDLVIEIFRHGARGPLNQTFDPTKPWGNNIGQLTPVGMRMHYLLGEAVKDRYPKLLGKYDPNEVYVRSTDINRTIMSAYSHMYGVYQKSGPSLAENISQVESVPPFDSPIIQKTVTDLNTKDALPGTIQPAPVHVLLAAEDHVLRPWDACPNAKQWHKANEDQEATDVFNNDMAEIVKNLRAYGNDIQNWWDLYWAGDNGITNAFEEVTLPGGVDSSSQSYKDLKFAFEWFTVKIFEGSAEQRYLYAVNLLNAVQDFVNQKANGQTDLKFVLLSAHDTTLLTLLSAFGITTKECLLENYRADKGNKDIPNQNCVYPQYASNIIFEFYKAENKIVFKYNGNIITICGDKSGCAVPEFKDYVKKVTNSYTTDDYKLKCGLAIGKENPSSYLMLGGLATTCLILFVSLIMTCVSLNKKSKRISELGVQMEVQPNQNEVLLN